jgi:hypothetical protein
MRTPNQAMLALLLTGMQLAAAPGVARKEVEVRVRLLSPLDTATNKKGDQITAQVLTPAEFAGDILEGKVLESKGGAKVKGSAVLNFAFETIHHQEQAFRVQSSVKSVQNSKGKPDVDEEGRLLRKKNNLAKAGGIAGIGSLIGGLAGGIPGAIIGAGAGAAAGLVLIKITAKGANVAFAPGSEFVLAMKDRR